MSLYRPLLLLILALLPSLAWPQQEPLGRLFFTPQQRAALDRQREQNRNFVPNASDSESRLTINGEVRRSSGRSTRWINGEADWNAETPTTGVPVGDTFHPGTGERESLLGEGRIVVKPGGARR
ncbi:MAG: hypothetical protein CVU16_01570 [Betaproteobacteria bacterium HGW-Betaproteobacteria-10]|nr:MAG: hypothetical protein CVU16_01570 [Betaproteobacteria bacterium HGW-Betaproteobacteria-10]